MPVISGTNSNDTLSGTAGDDTISGFGGNDIINLSTGVDFIDGGSSSDSDTLQIVDGALATFGLPAAPHQYVLTFNRLTEASGALNTQYTNVEQIEIVDRSGADVSFRTEGSNSFFSIEVGTGIHSLFGRSSGSFEIVIATIENRTSAVNLSDNADGVVQISQPGGTNITSQFVEFFVIQSRDVTRGLTVNSTVSFSASSFTIIGTEATDLISGGAGRDTIIMRGTANDADRYSGGVGADVFVIQGLNRFGVNGQILDFSADDRISLRTSIFDTTLPRFIGTSEFSGVAGQVRYELANNTTIVTADTNGDRIADQLVTITNGSFNLAETTTNELRGTLVAPGTATPINGTEGNDVLSGSSANDFISGLGGNDTISGGAGDDTISGGAGNDIINGGAGIDNLSGGDGNDFFTASAPGEIVAGERIDGGAGFDILYLSGGGEYQLSDIDLSLIEGIDAQNSKAALTAAQLGNLRDSTGNFRLTTGGAFSLSRDGSSANPVVALASPVYEFSDQATRLSALFYSAANISRGEAPLGIVVRGGAAGDVITGSSYNDTIEGGGGNDTLDGGVAIDTLAGGGGNDVFVVDVLGDIVVEAAGGGNDTVFAKGSYTLRAGTEIETLSTISNAGVSSAVLAGNEFSQTIIGDFGNNSIAGGGVGAGGGDVLVGLRGDDTYTVESRQMFLIENAGEGNDLAIVTLGGSDFVLNANSSVETLRAAAGTEAINITGNPDSQRIEGNAGNNILSTGSGAADTLVGGLGDDIYRVFGGIDTIVETAGQGLDRVFVSGNSFALNVGASVEYVSVSVQADTGNFYLVGNEVTQVIVGNFGDNTLDGNSTNSGSADTMIGLVGNDTYRVNVASDGVVEQAGQGSDTVLASINYQLRTGVSVETLSAVAQTASDANSQYTLIGNEVAQVVIGNDAANTLDGRGGSDVLIGRGGADLFAFTAALGTGNIDQILDFASGSDRIGLASDVFAGVSGGVTVGSFVIGTTAADGDDRILYDQATGRLFYDADANGAGAAVQFAQLNAGTMLSVSDFLVVAPVADIA